MYVYKLECALVVSNLALDDARTRKGAISPHPKAEAC